MEIEEGVIRRGRRPRRITPSENSIILHVIRKPNDYVTDYVTDEESLKFLKCLFHGTSFGKRRSKFIEPLTGNNRAIDSKKKTHTHAHNVNAFHGNEKHMPYKADTTRRRSRTQNMFPLVSAAILKLMVKITSMFGSYRFLKNSKARHFLTFRSLSSQLEFVLILGSRRENAHLVKFNAWTIQSPSGS